MDRSSKTHPFSVGRNDGTGIVTRHATLGEAEAQIVAIEKVDPAGVHAGDYYVDGPEELINPPAPPRNMKLTLTFELGDAMQTMGDVARSVAEIPGSLSDRDEPLQVGNLGVAWDHNDKNVGTWEVTDGPAADWAACCRASRRIWELVNAMYQKSDPQALALSPTSTCAEIIAAELGIPYGE